MRILLLLVGVAVLSGEVLAADVAEMSASDVIAKSEASYAAVKTYVGTTTVRAKTDFGGRKMEQVASAKVTFMRPGRLRVEGMTSSLDASGKGGKPFAIVSDGKTTWRSLAIVDGGAFKEVKNLAMAGMAGVANGAAEGIPAALMKSEGAWTAGHDPFDALRLSAPKLAGHEKIGDADCYKLVAKNPKLSDVTLWIDSKSFLLRQMTREYSAAQLAAAAKGAAEALQKIGRQPPANVPAIKSKSDVFSFTIDQVDGEVDVKLFNRPTKSLVSDN